MSVLLETSAGDLVIDLLIEESPKACLNFLKLCKLKYYNFSPFYNLQKSSFFQGGDPLYPVGDGGSSCWGLENAKQKYFKPEISQREHERGTISMACLADGYCGSQFFVSLGPNPAFDKKHAIFGRLAEGFDVLDKIEKQAVDDHDRPLRDIRIQHTIILEDPFEDPPGLPPVPAQSPLPTKLQLSTVRLGFDESIEEVGTIEEIEARKRANEAAANALILETLGDLPFAAIRPPENTLFVCKLNPITSSESLELVFSRFGKILSCQVVKDSRTGDSLQYAFIEFDLKEAAETAYFKMQSVLIDDRRIHVDFSQSVAKIPKSKFTRPRDNRSSKHDGYDMVFDNLPEQRHRPKSSRDTPREEGRHRHSPHSRDARRRRSRSRSTSSRSRYDRRDSHYRR